MFADFLKAAIPDPVTCLGVRLRPLSLGSLLLLYRFENAFALGLPPSNGDLLRAVIICSLPFKEAQTSLASPDLERDLAKWTRKIRGCFGWFKSSQERIDKAKILFAEYFAEASKYPCTKTQLSGPARELGSAWPMLLLTGLMAELNQDFDSAVNQPLCLSRWLVAVNGERKADLEIVEFSEVENLQAEADQIAREVEAEEVERLAKEANGVS